MPERDYSQPLQYTELHRDSTRVREIQKGTGQLCFTEERGNKEVQGSQCTQEGSFSCSILNIAKKIKGEHPGLFIGDVAKKLGEMWNNTAADGKQPYEKKAAKLKEKYEKDIAAFQAKGKPYAAEKGVVKAKKSKKKEQEEDEEEGKMRKKRKMKRMKMKKMMMN
ncbi:High mobility group protein B1 [Tupaia chinensis]|uniref:High mobility group protein B1 n=1 Tax=Tupaia chinensis TaxID=246437 RepID=L9K3D4_TUPCH|nr:High mobility group protein B1 [Tupaia chinensis]